MKKEAPADKKRLLDMATMMALDEAVLLERLRNHLHEARGIATRTAYGVPVRAVIDAIDKALSACPNSDDFLRALGIEPEEYEYESRNAFEVLFSEVMGSAPGDASQAALLKKILTATRKKK